MKLTTRYKKFFKVSYYKKHEHEFKCEFVKKDITYNIVEFKRIFKKYIHDDLNLRNL